MKNERDFMNPTSQTQMKTPSVFPVMDAWPSMGAAQIQFPTLIACSGGQEGRNHD